jgi:hypothetical protein
MLDEQGRLPSMTPEEVEQRVHGALATDPTAIAAQVRAATLDALTRVHLDTDAIKRVTAAVVNSAREGAAPLGEHGGQALKEAMRGLGEALAVAAEAVQLAIQEAAGRTSAFSRQLIRAFITREARGRELDHDFDMAGEATPLLEQVLLAHAAPGALVRRGWRTLGSALAFVVGLPEDLSQLLRAARRGKLQVQVEIPPLKHLGNRLDRADSRLAISSTTTALIAGSAIVMRVELEPALPGLPSFALLGFIIAVIGSIWVLFSIWRGGKG